MHNYSFAIICNSLDMGLTFIPVRGFIKAPVKLSQDRVPTGKRIYPCERFIKGLRVKSWAG